MPTFDFVRHLQHLLYSSSWTLYVGVSNPTVCQELTHIARKMKLWKHLFFRYLDYIFMNLLVVYERFMHKDEPRIVNGVAHRRCFCKRPARLRAEYGVICSRIAAGNIAHLSLCLSGARRCAVISFTASPDREMCFQQSLLPHARN